MGRFLFLLVSCFSVQTCFSQYNWELEKEKNGISIYLSEVDGSKYKAVKVEATFTGTPAKLISVLTNVPQFNKWIYNTKLSVRIKQNSFLDFTYHSVTSMPFPLSDRDVAIHLKISTDSLPKFMTIKGVNDEDAVPSYPPLVRVTYYNAIWKVTTPTPQTIHISYILELDPGGGLSPALFNSFASKGPYETFSNLAEELKK